MQKLVLAVFVAATVLMAGNAQALSDCQLHVYAVDDQGHLAASYALGPEHVQSIEPFDSGVLGEELWHVTLTPEGADINSQFSAEQIGRQIAILCDGVELVRPSVRGSSHESFVFSAPTSP